MAIVPHVATHPGFSLVVEDDVDEAEYADPPPELPETVITFWWTRQKLQQ